MQKGQGLQEWQMFSVRMPKEQAARLEARAKQVGVSKTALVLIWIDQMLGTGKEVGEHATEEA